MDRDPSNITHGLLVLDPATLKDGQVEIVHFVGYWAEPTEFDVESLRRELHEDAEIGLCEIADRLLIVPAPSEAVEYYRCGLGSDSDG